MDRLRQRQLDAFVDDYLPYLRGVPAVLVTGDTAPDQVLRVHESGHIVLYKPVQPKELLTVLKKLA